MPPATPNTAHRTIGYACVVLSFWAAFLAFLVQPLISKLILPWFGGSPTVWTTCMLFFQLLLLAAYAYAHGLGNFARERQPIVHLILVVCALAALPITRAESFAPTVSTQPILKILVLLSATVGLPYFLATTTGPLVQTWYAALLPERSPYRLYAASNLGSLLALLAYPVFVEPRWSVHRQGVFWSVGFGLAAMLIAFVVVGQAKLTPKTVTPRPTGDAAAIRTRWLPWLFLPALASVMLLAVTNQICQNFAVVPFLWIAPLAVYLLSFILCFEKEAWAVPRWVAVLTVLSVTLLAKLMLADSVASSSWYFEPLAVRWLARNPQFQIVHYLVALFLICMVCHGEAVRSKPPAEGLTRFYLCLAAGGALGGVTVSLLCPLVFDTFLELNLGLLVSLLLAMAILYREGAATWFKRALLRRAFVGGAGLTFVMVAWAQLSSLKRDYVATGRNFYGVMTVAEETLDGMEPIRTLLSGTSAHRAITEHGMQYWGEPQRYEPTLYYTYPGGAGLALVHHQSDRPRRIGVVGLGVGTLAAYGKDGDRITFYEINPIVETFARQYFTYLSDSAARVEVLTGDGRTLLAQQQPQGFDTLLVDAFSGDAIPVHLLTREAFALYLKHLDAEGVIAFHVSNRYLDLVSVVVRQAEHLALPCVVAKHAGSGEPGSTASTWVLLSRNTTFLEHPEVQANSRVPTRAERSGLLWTDQQNNLFELLWRGKRS